MNKMDDIHVCSTGHMFSGIYSIYKFEVALECIIAIRIFCCKIYVHEITKTVKHMTPHCVDHGKSTIILLYNFLYILPVLTNQ